MNSSMSFFMLVSKNIFSSEENPNVIIKFNIFLSFSFSIKQFPLFYPFNHNRVVTLLLRSLEAPDVILLLLLQSLGLYDHIRFNS
jgi:hypothetical protein